jgi:hypothetical protein
MGLVKQNSVDGGVPTYMETVLGVKGVLVRSCADDVPARQRPAMPSLEAMRASKHHPVLLTPDPGVVGPIYNGSPSLTQEIPINGEVLTVDSELWEVRCETDCLRPPAWRTARLDCLPGATMPRIVLYMTAGEAVSSKVHHRPHNPPDHQPNCAWETFSRRQGKVMIHLNNLSTTDPAQFANKKRLVHVAAQGMFKRPVKCVS